MGKDVYKSSFLHYLETQSFFHQSVKNPFPASLSLGGVLGQKGPWHSTLYISHIFQVLSHEPVTK